MIDEACGHIGAKSIHNGESVYIYIYIYYSRMGNWVVGLSQILTGQPEYIYCFVNVVWLRERMCRSIE
jgi:hypothetical protein